MTEHISNNDLGDRYLVIHWQGYWYKLPFFLLEDLVSDCPGLPNWLMGNAFTWKASAILQIKEIIKDEMQFMEAYKMYDAV